MGDDKTLDPKDIFHHHSSALRKFPVVFPVELTDLPVNRFRDAPTTTAVLSMFSSPSVSESHIYRTLSAGPWVLHNAFSGRYSYPDFMDPTVPVWRIGKNILAQ